MRMPAAKKRRIEKLEDSFDDDPGLVSAKNGSDSNDSFDEDPPLEPGPSLLAERLMQSQGHQQSQIRPSQLSNQAAPPSASNPTETLAGEHGGHVFRPPRNPSPTPTAYTQSTTSTILTGGHKESGVVLMMKKRNENLARQLEDARREKVAKEMVHLQEKKNIEENYRKQLRDMQTQKETLQREILSMSFRHDNEMNRTMSEMGNTQGLGRSPFVPMKPMEKKSQQVAANRLAWMHKSPSSNNTVLDKIFKHPVNPDLDNTYVHISTQMMENSDYLTAFIPKIEAKPVQTVSTECQTENETEIILEPSYHDAIVGSLLSAAAKMSLTEFKSCNFRNLCRSETYKQLRRRPAKKSSRNTDL